MTTAEILAALSQISDRIDAAFDEAGDKYATDKHACLEQVGDQVSALIEAIHATTQEDPEMGACLHPSTSVSYTVQGAAGTLVVETCNSCGVRVSSTMIPSQS